MKLRTMFISPAARSSCASTCNRHDIYYSWTFLILAVLVLDLPDFLLICDCVPTYTIQTGFLFHYREQVRSDEGNALQCFRFKRSIQASVYFEMSIKAII